MEIFPAVLNCQLWVTTKPKMRKELMKVYNSLVEKKKKFDPVQSSNKKKTFEIFQKS